MALKKNKLILTSCYVLFIYLTLPIIRIPQRYFRKVMGKYFGWSINSVYVLLGIGFLYYLVKRRLPLKSWAVFILTIVASYFLLAECSTPEERIHLVEYGLLSGMVYWTVIDKWSVVKSQLLAIVLVALIGYVDELIQWVLPNRVYDNWDVLLNALSGVVGQMMVFTCRISEE